MFFALLETCKKRVLKIALELKKYLVSFRVASSRIVYLKKMYLTN